MECYHQYEATVYVLFHIQSLGGWGGDNLIGDFMQSTEALSAPLDFQYSSSHSLANLCSVAMVTSMPIV